MPQDLSGQAPWRRSRVVQLVPAPAAGADWTLTVPAGHLFRLRSILATLTTSAAVANRVARLQFGNGDATFLDLPPAAVQAASLGIRYAWVPGPQAIVVGTGALQFMPAMDLDTAWTVGTKTDLIDVADQWSAISALVDDVTVRRGALDLNALPDLLVQVVEPGPTD